jgi:hypothetical protein
MASRNSWKGIAAGAAVVLIAGTAFASLSTQDAGALEVTVYKSPTCGCCNKWIAHLEANGFEVNAHDLANLTQVRLEHGVSRELTSCHTALVDGYVIEGHVPAEDIQRLLQERPDVVGLAVPGMVIGSPGMEGATSEPYNVLTFDRDGNTTVFAKH